MKNAAATIEQSLAAAWTVQLEQAVKTPWILEALLGQGNAAAARFAYYYSELRRLPRHVRRALARRRGLGLGACAFLLALAAPQAAWGGMTFNVTTESDLNTAIVHANWQTGAYVGTNTIDLQGRRSLSDPSCPRSRAPS
jgi:hypothetical protein